MARSARLSVRLLEEFDRFAVKFVVSVFGDERLSDGDLPLGLMIGFEFQSFAGYQKLQLRRIVESLNVAPAFAERAFLPDLFGPFETIGVELSEVLLFKNDNSGRFARGTFLAREEVRLFAVDFLCLVRRRRIYYIVYNRILRLEERQKGYRENQ